MKQSAEKLFASPVRIWVKGKAEWVRDLLTGVRLTELRAEDVASTFRVADA